MKCRRARAANSCLRLIKREFPRDLGKSPVSWPGFPVIGTIFPGGGGVPRVVIKSLEVGEKDNKIRAHFDDTNNYLHDGSRNMPLVVMATAAYANNTLSIEKEDDLLLL